MKLCDVALLLVTIVSPAGARADGKACSVTGDFQRSSSNADPARSGEAGSGKLLKRVLRERYLAHQQRAVS